MATGSVLYYTLFFRVLWSEMRSKPYGLCNADTVLGGCQNNPVAMPARSTTPPRDKYPEVVYTKTVDSVEGER